jgi:hypothetical protein
MQHSPLAHKTKHSRRPAHGHDIFGDGCSSSSYAAKIFASDQQSTLQDAPWRGDKHSGKAYWRESAPTIPSFCRGGVRRCRCYRRLTSSVESQSKVQRQFVLGERDAVPHHRRDVPVSVDHALNDQQVGVFCPQPGLPRPSASAEKRNMLDLPLRCTLSPVPPNHCSGEMCP